MVKEKSESPYFELQSLWGFSKHGGGLKATEELIRLCRIERNNYVLDVGCGVGATACYLAEKYECRVVGVDISERMIAQAKMRAKGRGLSKVRFRVADVQDMPFEGGAFDVVIGESVIAFLDDKRRGIRECRRVVKSGGYVGFNEGTWMKTPPTELVGYMLKVTGGMFETSQEWKKLMEVSGLRDLTVKTYRLTLLSKIDELRMYGLIDYLNSLYRFLSLGLRRPDFWKFMKEAGPSKVILKSFSEYFGYGIYVGRK